MGWMGALALGVLVLFVLVVLPLVGLYLRRRTLSQSSAMFDCAMRLPTRRGSRWWTGMARYEGDELQWFRIFSLDLSPRVVLRRDTTAWVGMRRASADEAAAVYDEDRVVELTGRGEREGGSWQLAMSMQAATGLMSWLEAAPPGGDGYSGLDEAVSA